MYNLFSQNTHILLLGIFILLKQIGTLLIKLAFLQPKVKYFVKVMRKRFTRRYICMYIYLFLVSILRSNFLSVSGRSDSEPTMCLSLTPAPGGATPARRPSITVTSSHLLLLPGPNQDLFNTFTQVKLYTNFTLYLLKVGYSLQVVQLVSVNHPKQCC